jgi:hypothetical protein
MPETVKYGRCEPSNTVIALEALRSGDIGLNAASRLSVFFNKLEGTVRWDEMYCVENIQTVVGEELVSHFAVGTERVLWIHHVFTKPGF